MEKAVCLKDLSMHQKIVKHFLLPIHEKIFGRKTFRYIDELAEAQYMDSKALKELQFNKLRKLLIHSKKNIPYYEQCFLKAGFDPEKMQSIEDIQVLPLLSKEDIRLNLDNMKWNDCPGGLYRYNTGGSSGKPLVFYFDRMRQGYDAAARALTHQWFGVDVGDKELYLWGSPLEATKQDKLKDFRDKITNDLLISAFELSKDQIPGIVDKFKKFKPKCVFGYPSTITLFCEMAKEQGYDLSNIGIKAVFSTAEVLYDRQREVMGEYFGSVPVTDCYGSREGGFVSHECEKGTYHVFDPNYIVEYIKEGKPVKPGEDGEVILTHLDAWGMPFIRYRTGDVAQPGNNECSCGRTWSTIQNIKGRTTDFIITPDGRWQHALSLIYVIRDIEGVDEFKILQNKVDEIEVLLKTHKKLFPKTGKDTIVEGIKKRMGDSVNVTITITDSIPRDASGKFRYVVSKLDTFNV